MIKINVLAISGRLTKDPDIRDKNGLSIAKFGIAVEKYVNGKKGVDFFEVVAFQKLAEFAEKYLSKGTKINISGRIQQNIYETRDGEKRQSVSIVAERIEFCESKANSQKHSDDDYPVEDAHKSESSQKREDFMSIPDGVEEELPFS